MPQPASHPASHQALSIAGTVSGPASVVSGVQVTLSSPSADGQADTTGADGAFAFTGLVKGADYVVTPSAGAVMFDPPDHQYVPLLADVEDCAFAATALTVTGRTLLTGSTPAPLGGCLVELVDIAGSSQTTTSDPTTGRYSFSTGLQVGHSYTIQAAKDGYSSVFDPQPIGPLGAAIERDLYLSADPKESVVTKWLLPILGIASPPGLAALGWAIYTYLKPQLPAQASAADVEAAAAQVNIGQAVDAAAANNVVGQDAAAAVRAAVNPDLPLAQAPEEAASVLVGQAQTQVANNVAQNLVTTLTDAGSTSEQIVQTVSSVGTQEVPAVIDALGNLDDSATVIARIKAVFDTCIDIPQTTPAEGEAIAVGESGWSGAVVEASESGIGVTVDVNELGGLLPLAGETLEASAVSIEGVADVIIGAIVSIV